MSDLGAGRYALGVVALMILAGSLGYAAVLIRRRLLAAWTGAPARLAESVIGLALLTGLMELLGALGLFKLAPLVVASAAIALVFARTLPRDGHRRPRGTRGGVSVPWGCLAAIAAAAAVVAEWTGPTLISYDFGIRTFDTLWYHLPWAVSFAQSGQITTLHFTDVEYLTAFYPATAELFHGLGIVLLGGDLLSPGLNLLWLGLLLLAAYCVGAPLGAGVPTLIGGALAMATPMMLLSQAGSAANDVVGVFFLVAAVALVVREPEGSAALALAAIAAGLAVSVKLSLLAPVLALTIAVLAWRRSARLWLLPLALAGGFWYLRNLIAVGNPLPWLDLPGLAVPATPLQAHTSFSVAHYLFQAHFWSSFGVPALTAGFGSWWWAVVGAAVVGPLLSLGPGPDPRPRLVGVVALASLLAYLVTPESAAGPAGYPLGFAFNLRYSAPALTMSLVALPLAPVLRRGWGQISVTAGLGAVLVATLAAPRLWPHGRLLGQVVVGAVAALVALVGLGAQGELTAPNRGLGAARPRVPGAPVILALRPRLVLVVLLGVAVVLAGGGFVGQRRYFRRRYSFQPRISQLSRTWAFFRHVHHARVGVVGTFGGFFAYPLYGVDGSNHVQYIAAHGPHGSFTTIGTCPSWRRAVNAARLQYLVSTPARDPWHSRVLTPSAERGWTAGDPAVTIAFQGRAGSGYITVFAVHGRLDPSRCPPSSR